LSKRERLGHSQDFVNLGMHIIEKIEADNGEIELEFVDEQGVPSDEDLELIELDRRGVKKIRANATLFTELFDPDTSYIYDFPFRRRIEVDG
jgi:hypothetical protein